MVSLLCLCVVAHKIVSDVSLGTRPQDSLVDEEDVKKPKGQTKSFVALNCMPDTFLFYK